MKTEGMGRILAGLTVALTCVQTATGQTGALREVWTDISGYGVSSLESFGAYPHAPVISEVIDTLEAPSNWQSYYGQRIRAWLVPTQSRNYTFFISGDDSAELWLSSDASPDNAARIARVKSWTDPEQWDKYEQQQSEPIYLSAGQRYYIEVLHKEHSGGDHVAVAWDIAADPVIIGTNVLRPFAEPAPGAESGLLVEAGTSTELYLPASEIILGGQVLDHTGLSGGYSVAWSAPAGVEIEEPNRLYTNASFPGAGEYELSLTVSKRDIVETDRVSVTVHPRLDAEAGSATQQFWLNTSGADVEHLTGHLEFPLYPHMTRSAEALAGPTNFLYYYGTRTIGYLLPPRTGSYQFHLSADDSARFSLSTDDAAENLRVVAQVTSATPHGDFYIDPANQISEPVELTKGQRYYFELLHKDHGSSDHHSVFWAFEGDDVIELITGEFLAPAADLAPEAEDFTLEDFYLVYAGRGQTLHLPERTARMDGYVIKRRSGSQLLSQNWSVAEGPGGVVFVDPADPATDVIFPGAGSYVLRFEVVTDQQTVHDEVRVEVLDALAADTGLLTREVWFNRYFTSLDQLRAHEEFPDQPHIVDSLTALRGPVNWSSKYATRVTGWLHPPQSGDYTFYVTGDDEVEFRISSDEGEANLELACRVPSPTRTTNWFDHPEQRSDVIALEAGRRYFVELLHRETWSSDHFQVAWTIGDDREPAVIAGSYFTPARAAAEYREEVTYYAYAGADRKYFWPHDHTTLSGSIQKVRSSEAETTVRWEQVDGPRARLSGTGSLEAEVQFSAPGRHVFRLTVAAADGVEHQDEVLIDLLPELDADTGSILRSVWLDIPGYYIDDLLEHDPELAYPDFEDLLPGAETPQDWAHYYGTRLAGFLNVPEGEGGQYTFWIASNDQGELWLSPSTDPGAAQRIAFVSSAVSPRRWDYREGQESAPVFLAPGRYYIEARQKEYTSGDHLALAWEGPATNGRELISRGFLSPLRAARMHDPNIQVVLGPDRVLLWPNDTLRLSALVYDLEEGPEPLTFAWKEISTDPSVEFSDPHFPGTDATFPGPGIYELVMFVRDGKNAGYDRVTVTVQDPLEPATGGILREVYTDISGYRVSDLTAADTFPDQPEFRDTLTSFDTPVDWADNYGTRLRGYIRVPEDDDYTFFIASDDASELWLNPQGADPDGKQRIAFTNYGTGRYRWTRYESQGSGPIALQAGTSYYVEVLHKAGTGADYLSVAWRRGNDPEAPITVIQGAMLIPFEEAEAMDEAIAINAGEDRRLHWPFEYLELHGTALDLTPGPQPLAVAWSMVDGAGDVEFDAPNALQTVARFSGPGDYTLQLTATDGRETRSDTLRVRIDERLAADTGSILCEIFEDISGYRVVDLLNAEAYPNAPDSRAQLKQLEIPQDFNNTYGARIRGYLHPHASGVHRFNISGDDWAELYLSTDESAENKELVCFTPSATYHYEWLRFPEYQVSRPILLEAGRKYYLEARLKDHSSRDHLAVAWYAPGSEGYGIVPGANLSPLALADSTAPVIEVQGAPEIMLTVDSEFIDPGIVASDDVDGDLTGDVIVDHNIDTSTPGDYAVRYRVVDAAGNESQQMVRRVRVVLADAPPSNYPADRSGNHPSSNWVELEPGQITDLEAARFLIQASFGPSEEAIAEVKEIGFEAWIDRQLAMAPNLHLPELDRYARFAGGQAATTAGMMMPMEMMPGMGSMMMSDMLPMAPQSVRDRHYVWWTHAIKAPDQLRQRMAFALSQILVISDRGSELSRYPRGTTNYYDLLVKGAFGNYGELLEQVTLNPMMGIWLTRIRSSKDSPDENYPREIMQLFSIGLVHLNQDGTRKLGADGEPMATYDQSVILDLSRALTGWTYSGSQWFYYTPSMGVDSINPLIPFEEEHDRGAKTLLGGQVLPAGQTATQDLQASVKNVFEHPNVGPFICRQLIQRMVTSNPSPAYLHRVAGVFNDNGEGVRGDLGAVVKAILLDEEAREMPDDSLGGKLREPILRLANLFRACYRAPSSNPPTLGRFVVQDTTDQYGQAPLSAATVFNFFEPDYSLPGALQDAGLYSPEFQIVNELTAVDMANHLFDGVRYGFGVRSEQVGSLRLELDTLVEMAADPDALVDHVEIMFLGREADANTRARLKEAVTAYAENPEAGAKAVLQILVAMPEFGVQK